MDKLLDLWKQREEVFRAIQKSEDERDNLAVGVECMKRRLEEIDEEIEVLRIEKRYTKLDVVRGGQCLLTPSKIHNHLLNLC